MPDPYYLAGFVVVLVGAALLRKWELGRALLQSAKTTAILRGVTASIDKVKDRVHATGDAEDADVVRELTRTIASELVPAGLANHLDDFLKAHGLNQSPKLRDTKRIHDA